MSPEKASRWWIAGAALFSGASAAVGWLATIYSLMTTPKMTEITFTNSHGTQTVMGKATFLFAMPAFETLIFMLALYANVRWHQLVRKMAERMAPYDVWESYPGFSMLSLCRSTSVGIGVMSLACLSFALQRAISLIGMP
jgi:hypothetical protein